MKLEVATWLDLFKKKSWRRTAVGTGVAFFQQVSESLETHQACSSRVVDLQICQFSGINGQFAFDITSTRVVNFEIESP